MNAAIRETIRFLSLVAGCRPGRTCTPFQPSSTYGQEHVKSDGGIHSSITVLLYDPRDFGEPMV